MASIYLRGRIWWICYRENGRKFDQSLKTKDKTVARFKKNELENRLSLGDSPLQALPKPIKELVKEYEQHCLTHNTPKTVAEDIRRIKDFMATQNIHSLKHISINALEAFLAQRMAAKVPMGRSTANRTIVNLKTFLNYLVDRNYLNKNPVAKVKLYKIETNPPEFYSKDEIDRLVDAAREDPEIFKLIVLGTYTGMRVNELMHLEWQDFDWTGRTVKVINKSTFKTKSRVFRVIPLSKALIAEIQPLSKKVGLVLYDMPNRRKRPPWRALYKAQRSAKVKVKGFHILRHTFASRLVQEGVSIYKVSKYLGHSSVRMTEIYSHLIPSHDNDIDLI